MVPLYGSAGFSLVLWQPKKSGLTNAGQAFNRKSTADFVIFVSCAALSVCSRGQCWARANIELSEISGTLEIIRYFRGQFCMISMIEESVIN